MILNKHETLCWYCEKAGGKCSWSKDFTPVEGWNAEPTKVKADMASKAQYIDSFIVHECPEFELVEYIKWNSRTPGFNTKEIKEAVLYHKRLVAERKREVSV